MLSMEPQWGAAEASYWHEIYAQNPALTRSLDTTSCPPAGAGILSCAGLETVHAEEHGRSCACPVRHPLFTLSAEAEWLVTTGCRWLWAKSVFSPIQSYVGGCLLLMLLEIWRSSVGAEEKRSANVQALSEAHKDNVCRAKPLCLSVCLMQSTESPGNWHINQGFYLWGMCSHHQIQWCL